jgi:cullin 3
LAKLVPQGVEIMTHCLSIYLRDCGKKLVESVTNPLQLIQDLLELKDKFDSFLQDSFLNDKEFKKTIQNDFTYFFNINQKNAEYLAIYIDDKLKKGKKNVSFLAELSK